MMSARHLHVHLVRPARTRDRAFEVTFRRSGTGELRKKRVDAPNEMSARVEAVRLFGYDVDNPAFWSVFSAREV